MAYIVRDPVFLGNVTAPTLNNLTLAALATGFTIAGGTTSKTLQINKTITLDATSDSLTLNIGAGGTLGSAAFVASTTFEAALGNPGVSGYVLSSTTGGVRSWVLMTAGFSNPMTTLGDIIVGGASGVAARLALGSAGQIPTVVGSNVAYKDWGFPVSISILGDLTAAITALSSVGTIASIPGTYTVSSDVSIPVGIKFAPMPGAVFTINNGVTLTINGPVDLDAIQYFNCIGTGKIVFGFFTDSVRPEWWGAKADSNAGNSYIGTNCTAALQAAINTLKPILLINGGYYVNASLTLPDETSNPNAQTIITGTNGNLNSGYLRGNCFIEADCAALFITKTAFSTTAYQSQVNIRNVCFFAHTSGTILFNNVNLMTSKFQDNLVVNFGQCFSITTGVTEISGNHFLGQRDSVYKMLSSNYAADTYIHHNYFNGYATLGTVVLIQLYSVAAFAISENYFDFAKTGIWLYYSGSTTAGKCTIVGNTFDILYEGIRVQQSNDISITSNIFRRCELASRASYMTANPTGVWSCVKIMTNSYNITLNGNNVTNTDAWLYLNGSGIWNISDIGNVGATGTIDISTRTLDTGTYPLDGQNMSIGGLLNLTAVKLVNNTPADTANTLYQVGGNLYFNGIQLAAGGGTTITDGYATIDFGAATNLNQNASLNITGQTGILTTSTVKAWVVPATTSNQGIDEHWIEDIDIYAGNIIAGTGFTIYAVSRTGYANGQYNIAWEWHN